MGRENLEDYNADFMCLLESWEATVGYFRGALPDEPESITIAAILGWTRTRSGGGIPPRIRGDFYCGDCVP